LIGMDDGEIIVGYHFFNPPHTGFSRTIIGDDYFVKTRRATIK